MILFQSKNFTVESKEKPEVDRLDGGHIVINPKVVVLDRTFLTPKLAIELARLTTVVGKALVNVMSKIGVEIGRVNYQDNGNWRHELHIHIYGRAKNSVYQKYGDPIISGYREVYQQLTSEDCLQLQKEIEKLLLQDEFTDAAWGL